jgi:hypothetical protein
MRHLGFALTFVGAMAMGVSTGGVAAAATATPHSDQIITLAKSAAESGAPLAGAVFTLYRWHGSCDLSKVVTTATSDAGGKAVFAMEGHHNYCVAETTAPAGYLLSGGAPVVVKTAHQTNAKGGDDPANVKESVTVAFVDTAQTTAPTTPPTTIPPGTTPPTAAVTGGGTSPASTAVTGATTVHTGEAWAGSAPYALGVLMTGAGLLGSGLLMRRRRVLG